MVCCILSLPEASKNIALLEVAAPLGSPADTQRWQDLMLEFRCHIQLATVAMAAI
jgi:hypothetical protein